VRKSIEKLEAILLENHLSTCIHEGNTSGGEEASMAELVQLYHLVENRSLKMIVSCYTPRRELVGGGKGVPIPPFLPLPNGLEIWSWTTRLMYPMSHCP
jgi:hypothetical protein